MFIAGDRVQLSVIGKGKYDSQAKGATGTVLRETSKGSGWFDVKWDHGYENNYEVIDLDINAPVVAEQSDEQKEIAARIKYMYSVQDDEGTAIVNTRDREYAREVKAYMGGKKEGIIIMAYAPVKEIR